MQTGLHGRSPTNRSGRRRGFTLVELMVVVVIVGVLAAVGMVALRQHAFAAKSAEALAMIQSIRAAQERFFAEHGHYLNVTSGPSSWYPRQSLGNGEGRRKVPFFTAPGEHADDAGWRLLNPATMGPVHFVYQVMAGLPTEAMPAPSEPVASPPQWPSPPMEHWYVIQAKGDVDGDGREAYFLAASLNNEIFRQNEGE